MEKSSLHITPVRRLDQFDPIGYVTLFSQPAGTVLPGIDLDGTDRDLPVGDWIDYQVYGTDSYLFRADNVTKKIYLAQEITLPTGKTSISR